MDINGKKVQWYQKKKKKFGTACCCLVAKSCLTLVTPWTVAHQSVQGVYVGVNNIPLPKASPQL